MGSNPSAVRMDPTFSTSPGRLDSFSGRGPFFKKLVLRPTRPRSIHVLPKYSRTTSRASQVREKEGEGFSGRIVDHGHKYPAPDNLPHT